MVILELLLVVAFLLMTSTAFSIFSDRSKFVMGLITTMNILVYLICIFMATILIIKLIIYK